MALLALPPEIFRAIMQLVLFDDTSSFLNHIDKCRHLRCHRIDTVLRQLQLLRLTSWAFRRQLLDVNLATPCVRIGYLNTFPSDPPPLLNSNLAQAVSLEIEIGYLTHDNIRMLGHMLAAWRNLHRLSIDASFPTIEHESEYEDRLRRVILPAISFQTHPHLVAFLLHVPIDTLSLLDSATARLRTVYFTTYRTPNSSLSLRLSTWHALSTLCLYLDDSYERTQTVLKTLLLCTFTCLENLWFSYGDNLDTNMLLDFVSFTSPTVNNITLLPRSVFPRIIRIPSSSILHHLECSYSTVLDVLEHAQPSLRVLVLHGFHNYNGPEPDQMPGLEKARHLDYVLWRLWTENRLHELEEVQLQHPLQFLFSNTSIDLFETTIYSYWSAVFQSLSVRFIDSNDSDILPGTWNLTLRRKPPQFPF